MAAENEFEEVERVEVKDNYTSHLERLENFDELALKYKGLEQYQRVTLEEIKMDANGDPILKMGGDPEDMTPLIPIEFPNLQTEDDGWMGIPIFTQLDLDVLKRIGADAEGVGINGDHMKAAVEEKKKCEAAIKEFEDSDGDKPESIANILHLSLDNAIFNYHHHRNMMILHKIIAAEYASIIKEGSEEIFKVIGSNIDRAIRLYIESEPVTEEDVDFVKDNLVQVMIYRSLKNAKSSSDDLLYKMATAKTPVEFERYVIKTLNQLTDNVVNLQKACDLEKLSPDEAGVVKVVRSLTAQFRIHSFHLPNIEEQPNCAPTNFANLMLLAINQLGGSTAACEYKNERKKWKNEVGRIKKDNKKMYGDSKFHANTPFSDLMLRKRLNALFTDMHLLKKMYIGSLIITPDIGKKITESELISDTNALTEAYKNISGHEIFYRSVKAFVSTFIYHHVFTEFAKIVALFRSVCQGEHDGIPLLKNKNNHDFKKLRHFLMITCFQEKNSAEPMYTVDKDDGKNGAWVKRCEKVRRVYFEYVSSLFDKVKNLSVDLEKFL